MNTPEIPPPPRMPDVRLSGHGVRVYLPGALVMLAISALTSGLMVRCTPAAENAAATESALKGIQASLEMIRADQRAAMLRAETDSTRSANADAIQEAKIARVERELAEVRAALGVQR